MKVIDAFSFILFVLSVAAMDSDSIVLPSVICIISSVYLLWRSNKSEMQEIENKMVVDWAWDEIEYGVPSRRRIKRERQAYEEAEREDRENEYIV